ncbi:MULTISPECIES: PLP-dependent aminotransferase family protein [unclassified Streptomyces]|uniref:MocR-like transcription factor YczR n=1 Tax=unclassified Streptomyces TaxID=2593676 RepID=UPI000C2784E5|nr:PLP-dependent aminotransferase family protein [Streptomyces sp. CB01201]PJM97944.1 GntR family transcriptional regulator [Streptomyces sp. CB01201]
MAEMRVVRSLDTTSSAMSGTGVATGNTRTLGSRQLAGQVTAITGPHPGYRALAQGVRALLLDGRIPLHTRLPAERELATALEVSRATVTAAYDLLREGGYALSRRGAGTWTGLPEGAAPASVAGYQAPDGVIDLAMAAPSAPAELAAAFELAGPELACHATTNGYHPLGLPELRAAVAERYTRRGLPTLPEQILITTGAQSAVSLVVNLLGRPGDRAVVESPSYPNALDAVRHAGLRITPVPVTEDGWDVELLECTLRQTAPRLAYLIPDFQNPTGALMSTEQRTRLLRAARTTGTWLLIDETMAEMALEGPAPAPFVSLAHPGEAEQIVTVGSLSKTHWGGLRIGWVRAGSRLVNELAALRIHVDLAPSLVDQVLAKTLLPGMDDVLRTRLPLLRERRDALADSLSRHLPEWRWQTPVGGLSLWVDLGRPIAGALAQAALAHGVNLQPGSRFAADAGTHEHRLRLPFVHEPERTQEAVRRLAATLDAGLPAVTGGQNRPHWVA